MHSNGSFYRQILFVYAYTIVFKAIRIHVTSTVINDQNFNFKNSSCFFNLLYYSNVK